MKKIVAMAAVVLALVSCQENKGFFISGTAKGMEDGSKIYVSQLTNPTQRPERIDSTVIEGEKFELDMEEVESPNLSFLEFENLNGNVIFIAENEQLSIEVYKDSIRNSKVKGGQENIVLTTYLDHLKEMNKKVGEGRQEMQQAFQQQDSTKLEKLQKAEQELMDNDKVFKKKMVEDHPDSFVSVMVISDLLNMKSYPTSEIKELYESLNDKVKQSKLAKSLENNLESAGAVDIGSKAPNFTAPTPEGGELSLNKALGAVTIVDFWAAWCKPCRVENPNVVKIYEKYHDQGLEIVGVSLDRPGEKDKWLQAIEDDGLPWHQVSNLQFWNDPVAKKYGIRAIPATFILDEEGVIVARDLRGDELEAKVAELLDK